MSRKMSRRELSVYAIRQLTSGAPAKPLAKKLAAALIESGRAKEAELLASDILAELERRGRLARVEISSAHTLNKELSRALVKFAKDYVKVDQALANFKIEPRLIGGFRLETAAKVWDKTIARKLSDIKGGTGA